MSEQPSQVAAMRRVLTHLLAGVFVARPGKVTAYDTAAQTVDVTPTLKQTLEKRDSLEVKEPALIKGVPVCFPRGGGYFVSFPIQPGDYVLLVFADRSLDRWLASGGIVDPIDLRRHAAADAIAIPGVFPGPDALSDALASGMVLGQDGGSQIVIKDSGEIHVGSVNADDFVAKATETNSNFDAIVTELGKIQTTLGSLAGATFGTSYTNAFTSASDVKTSKLKAD